MVCREIRGPAPGASPHPTYHLPPTAKGERALRPKPKCPFGLDACNSRLAAFEWAERRNLGSLLTEGSDLISMVTPLV